MTETLTKKGPIEELAEIVASLPGRKDANGYRTLHRFTPGLYSRTVFLPKGDMVLSKLHKTEHQFVISAGVVKIWTLGVGWDVFQSPHFGVTKPGSQRVVVAICDTVWTTFHATDKTDLTEIEKELFE